MALGSVVYMCERIVMLRSVVVCSLCVKEEYCWKRVCVEECVLFCG